MSVASAGVIICGSNVLNADLLPLINEFDISDIEIEKRSNEMYYCFCYDELAFNFLRFTLVKRRVVCSTFDSQYMKANSISPS